MKKSIIFFSFILIANFIFSQDVLSNLVNKISNSEKLNNATLALSVFDISNNKSVYQNNANKSLKPASNLKVLTTASALATFGPNHKFTTYLKYSGKIENNILNGDLYIIGGGDPTLGSALFSKDQMQFIDFWINDLKRLNIIAINGNIIIVDTLFSRQSIPTTWVWGDIGNYYGAGVSSISIFDNQYKIYFDTKVPLDSTVKYIKTKPELPYFSLENNVTAKNIRRDKSNIYATPLCNNKVIEGFLPVNKDSFIVKGSISQPAKVLGRILSYKLQQNGINIKRSTIHIVDEPNEMPEAPNGLTLISETESPSLIDIIEKTNKKSINLYAETLLRHISLSRNKDGSNSSGTGVLKYYWKNRGVDISAMKLYDGSGLSSYNLISANEIVDVLKIIEKDSLKYPGFISTLPVSGKSGTLKSLLYKTSAKGHIIAKSGSMSGVRAYSGYINTKKGNFIAFSLLINNYTTKSSIVKKYMEDILLLIYLNY